MINKKEGMVLVSPNKQARFGNHLGEEQLGKMAANMMALFIQRGDLYARQLPDGRYICMHQPLTKNHIIEHLRGDITLGTYLLDHESQARFLVLDADDPVRFDDLVALARRLAQEGIPMYLEYSRRGGHAWIFFPHSVDGKMARAFGRNLMTIHHLAGLELFPKQDQLTDGPGSLIRLPMGIHRRSRQRYGFFSPDGQALGAEIYQQVQALVAHQTISERAFHRYLTYISPQHRIALHVRRGDPRDTLTERIKGSISVLDFVGQFIQLRLSGSGAVGRCPFHDDNHPSFGVNTKENYWYCFAGCGGGSIIDFWMRWCHCQFPAAVKELAAMML